MNSSCLFFGHHLQNEGYAERCINCDGLFVWHQCSIHCGLAGMENWKLLPLATALASIPCPQCGEAVNLALKAKSFDVPTWASSLLDAVIVGALGYAFIKAISPTKAS